MAGKFARAKRGSNWDTHLTVADTDTPQMRAALEAAAAAFRAGRTWRMAVREAVLAAQACQAPETEA